MKYFIKGKLYNPIKMGDPGDWYFGEPKATCGDCGVKYGETHLEGCDIERCPCCGLQFISCDCGAKYEVKDNITKSQLKRLKEEQKIQTEADRLEVRTLINKGAILYDSTGP